MLTILPSNSAANKWSCGCTSLGFRALSNSGFMGRPVPTVFSIQYRVSNKDLSALDWARRTRAFYHSAILPAHFLSVFLQPLVMQVLTSFDQHLTTEYLMIVQHVLPSLERVKRVWTDRRSHDAVLWRTVLARPVPLKLFKVYLLVASFP